MSLLPPFPKIVQIFFKGGRNNFANIYNSLLLDANVGINNQKARTNLNNLLNLQTIKII